MSMLTIYNTMAYVSSTSVYSTGVVPKLSTEFTNPNDVTVPASHGLALKGSAAIYVDGLGAAITRSLPPVLFVRLSVSQTWGCALVVLKIVLAHLGPLSSAAPLWHAQWS